MSPNTTESVTKELEILQFEADIHLRSEYVAHMSVVMASLCLHHLEFSIAAQRLIAGVCMEVLTDLGKMQVLFLSALPNFGEHRPLMTWQFSMEQFGHNLCNMCSLILCLNAWDK